MAFIERISVIFMFILFGTVACTDANKEQDTDVQSKEEQLPVIGKPGHTIPPFELVNQNGDTITEQIADDKIIVADFFFTRCPTICPIMTSQLKQVQKRTEQWKEEMVILSHSVDPVHDSVEVLKRYAEESGVGGSNWHLMTGDSAFIYNHAEQGYMLSAGVDTSAPGGILHSSMIMLVDKQKRIRGMYDGIINEEVDQLINDIEKLIGEEKGE